MKRKTLLCVLTTLLWLQSFHAVASTTTIELNFDDWTVGTTADGTFAVPTQYAVLFTNRASAVAGTTLTIISKNAADKYLKMNFTNINGQGFWLNLPSPYQTTDKQTVSFDAYFTADSGAGALLVNIMTPDNYISRRAIAAERIIDGVGSAGSVWYSSNTAITDTGVNKWINVMYVLDPTEKTFDLYINGNLLTTLDYYSKAGMTGNAGASMLHFYNNAAWSNVNEVWVDNIKVVNSAPMVGVTEVTAKDAQGQAVSDLSQLPYNAQSVSVTLESGFGINAATVNADTVKLMNSQGEAVIGAVNYDAQNSAVVFTFDGEFTYEDVLTLSIDGVSDLLGVGRLTGYTETITVEYPPFKPLLRFEDGAGQEITSLTPGHTLTGKMRVINRTENDVTTTLIMSVYQDGSLYKITQSAVTAIAGQTTAEISVNCILPESGDVSAALYAWDGLLTMNRLGTPLSIK